MIRMGFKMPKKKMTEKQKKAASQNLKKARAAKKPSENKSIHESVRNLPESNPLCYKNVKEWIKTQKDLLQSIKHYKNSKNSKEVARYYKVETYITNLNNYLRTGVYNDLFYGNNMQHKIKYYCEYPSYDKDGNIKRSYGVFYDDIGLYTGE
jgi:hypothetical protein